MYAPSEYRQSVLDRVQSKFRTANLHPSNQQWRMEAIENFGFYDGSAQWLPGHVQKVRERGQIPLTINVIQGRIDAISGVEIQSRYGVAVQDDSGKVENEKLAKGVTHLFYYIQKDQGIPHKGSLKFRDHLICGLGWSNEYKENGKFFYEYVHPFNVIPDPDDLSPQFENMKYVCRKRWMDPQMVRKLWPKVSKYIDFSDPNITSTVYSPEIMDRNVSYTNFINYSGYSQSRTLVCEVQEKIPRRAYYGIDYNGFYFETFDEQKAEEIANSPSDIEEKESTQILRSLFLDNFLLEHAPLNPNIPDLKDFTYIPSVWKRRTSNGVCYGLVDCMKDIQRDTNVRLTKSLYLANSSRLIVTGSLPAGDTIASLEKKLKRPDAAILLPPNTKFELKDNAPLSDAQMKFISEYDGMMQRVTGIYDDLLGRETNASSGVAQRQRQINSVRNNVFAFDNFADMKEREARFMLALIQGGDSENLLSQILTEEEKEYIILNMTREINGKKYVFNDIRTLPLSLEIEEVPDYKSSVEENRVALENLLSNPNAMFIMQSPTLMKRFGIRDYEKLSSEIQNAMAQRQAANQPVAQNPVSPEKTQQNLAYPGL